MNDIKTAEILWAAALDNIFLSLLERAPAADISCEGMEDDNFKDFSSVYKDYDWLLPNVCKPFVKFRTDSGAVTCVSWIKKY